VFCAKFRDRRENFIPIARGDDVHFSAGAWEAVLLYGNNFCDFSLRLNGRSGREVLSLQIRRYDAEGRRPRRLNAFLHSDRHECPAQLVTTEPIRTDNDAWIVDLNADAVLSSIKNCRLEWEGTPYCYVRKVGKNVLEIEARAIDEVCLFAIAVASFICGR
jgi:hypothetical protein